MSVDHIVKHGRYDVTQQEMMTKEVSGEYIYFANCAKRQHPCVYA